MNGFPPVMWQFQKFWPITICLSIPSLILAEPSSSCGWFKAHSHHLAKSLLQSRYRPLLKRVPWLESHLEISMPKSHWKDAGASSTRLSNWLASMLASLRILLNCERTDFSYTCRQQRNSLDIAYSYMNMNSIYIYMYTYGCLHMYIYIYTQCISIYISYIQYITLHLEIC